MRHQPIDPALFRDNRHRLRHLLKPNSVAVVNANDLLPSNADALLPMVPNSDLFYLTGVEQEESILLLAPDAQDPQLHEVLFVREPNPLLKTWEGHKLSKEEASAITGVANVKWLSDFPAVFHALACASDQIYLNSNEHARAVIEVETRDARFAKDVRARYPLHRLERLAPLLRRLRVIKSPLELSLLKEAIDITAAGFSRVARYTRPGVNENEIEAEFAHEFIRRRAKFAYNPIIAGGANSCVLHYNANDQKLKKGDVLLLDVAASYANYNADLTRTIPVSGKFSKRQKQVYAAVLRVLRAGVAGAVVGKTHRDWQREAQQLMGEELVGLGLLKKSDLRKKGAGQPACFKYFMHGLGHPLGLDVHDVVPPAEPFAPGWVLTVEPGIYIPEEGFGIRLENDILLRDEGPLDLMAHIPIEADDVEALMRSKE